MDLPAGGPTSTYAYGGTGFAKVQPFTLLESIFATMIASSAINDR
jgi:hypothetical protein